MMSKSYQPEENMISGGIFDTDGKLCEAAAFGDIKTIKYLVKRQGIDVNSPEKITGNTPLIWSIINSKFKVARLLIRMGADINTAAFNERTAYDWAQMSNNKKIAGLLMNRMKSCGECSKSCTATTTTTRQGWRIIPNFIKRFGTGGLHHHKAIKDSMDDVIHEAAMQRTSQSLKTLIKDNEDIDLNIQNKQGETPLHMAIRTQRASTSKFLLASGVDISVQTSSGSTPLHFAVDNNATRKCDEIIKNLVISGADLSIEDSAGRTPLKAAFLRGDIRSAKIICKALPEDSSYVLDVFLLVIDFENIETLRILLKQWPNGVLDDNMNTILHRAVMQGKYEIIEELVSKIDVNARNSDGDTALNIAVEKKLNEIVCLLLHNNADVSIQNNQGDTPLHIAVQSSLLIFILLVDKCDKTVQNNDGDTAFHQAARLGKTEFINLMITENKPRDDPYSSNYDVRSSEFKDIQNNMKYTALHYACAENNYKIVEKLLEIDVDTNLKNDEGKTALDIAVGMDHLYLVSLFKGSKLCGNSLASFLCKVCIEIPISPKLIYQCENGHIYCSSCDESNNIQECPECGIPIRKKQRCREMENKLSLMFPNAELEGRVDSFECLFEY